MGARSKARLVLTEGKKVKAISLFAGVGGFEIALANAGIETVASVEIDNNARGVLKHRFPHTALFTDVTGVTGEQLREVGFDGADGVIVGGFPCQDLSIAGKRAGLAGSRSGLFWEIIRLLEETKAQYCILENVPGALSSQQGNDFAIILNALDELGYRLAWRILDAQYFGVPQRRRRVFIVGSLGDRGAAPEEILAITESSEWNFAQSQQQGQISTAEIATGA